MEREFNKKKITIVFGVLFSLIILMGSTYAFFTYSKSSEAFVITSNKISATFTEGTNSISFANAYPISDQFALENLDKLTYIDFTVSSEIADEAQAVEYEIFLTEEENNLLSSDYVKVYLTDENNKGVIPEPKIYSSLDNSSYNSSGKVIYKDNNPGTSTKNYRLYVWLDSSYSQNEVSQNFSFKVNLYAYNAENQNLSYAFKNAIEDNTTESCKTTVEEDGIIYISGTKDCIDFNYVWYSGKLWRITAIYPDGTMKMITDSTITAIAYGSDYNFYTDESTSSYMYQWLNEDFLDTLYNYENIIVTDYKWNVTSGNGTISYKLPTTVEEGATLVSAPVGLLNSYEYYKSYQNTSYGSGYLNIGYYWWLLNRKSTSSSYVWSVHSYGYNESSGLSDSNSGRPSINLKSTIQLSGGSGTKTDPYKIKGDKEEIVANTTLLNTRTSGEYVTFAGEDYRIVGTEIIVDSDTNEEKTITKLNKLDYIRDESDTVVSKKFASSVTFGLSTNTQSDDYWDYYLNNTWKTAIEDTYEEMLVEGTYYLGIVTNYNYKLSICQAASNTVTTKDCEKTTSTWTGYVGLPRYGEMFASQQGSGYSSSSYMWLITPYSSSQVGLVSYSGGFSNLSSPSGTYGVRPSINLTSEIVVTGGEGTPNSPYQIALPEIE